LDLSDEILMQGNEAIAKAVKTLDANGFNTEGEIGQATTTRTAGLLSVLLNEILELSLGEVDETTDDRIRLEFTNPLMNFESDTQQVFRRQIRSNLYFLSGNSSVESRECQCQQYI
jgi:hypothetical protein